MSVGAAISCGCGALCNIRLNDVTREQYCPTPLYFLLQPILLQNLTRYLINLPTIFFFYKFKRKFYIDVSWLRFADDKHSFLKTLHYSDEVVYNGRVVLLHLVFHMSSAINGIVLVVLAGSVGETGAMCYIFVFGVFVVWK